MPSIREVIQQLWADADASERSGEKLGFDIKELVKSSSERNAANELPSLETWLEIYDQYASWLSSLALVHLFDFGKRDQVAPPLDRACLSLSSALASQALAIRHLVVAGFDVTAKQVLRSFCEYLDVYSLLSSKPELAEEFSKTQTPEDSNAFWHKYLSKGKGKRLLDRGPVDEQDIGLLESMKEFAQWRREEDSILSMSAHPTFLAGIMSVCVPGANQSEFWPGFLGVKSDISIRTLRYAVVAMTVTLAHSAKIPFGSRGSPGQIEYDSEDTLHRHVKLGRAVLLSLSLYIIQKQETPELSVGREAWPDENDP